MPSPTLDSLRVLWGYDPALAILVARLHPQVIPPEALPEGFRRGQVQAAYTSAAEATQTMLGAIGIGGGGGGVGGFDAEGHFLFTMGMIRQAGGDPQLGTSWVNPAAVVARREPPSELFSFDPQMKTYWEFVSQVARMMPDLGMDWLLDWFGRFMAALVVPREQIPPLVEELAAGLPPAARALLPDETESGPPTDEPLPQSASSSELDPEKILGILAEKVDGLVGSGEMDRTKGESLKRTLQRFGAALDKDEDDPVAMRRKGEALRRIAKEAAVTIGSERTYPGTFVPPGSRAAHAIKLVGRIHDTLLQAWASGEAGGEERDERSELVLRCAQLEKTLHEVASSEKETRCAVKLDLRPIARAARRHSAVRRAMLTAPQWSSRSDEVDPNAVFFSGRNEIRVLLEAGCRPLDLQVQPEPTGDSYDQARWRDLCRAHVAVFDFAGSHAAELAHVAYELGIAQTLGTAVVVVEPCVAALPFDVDVAPIPASDLDETVLGTAVEDAMAAVRGGQEEGDLTATVAEAVRVLGRRHEAAARSFVQEFAQAREVDNVAAERGIEHALAKEPKLRLIHPRWTAAYPRQGFRLFHALPYSPPAWAKEVQEAVRGACDAQGVEYVLGSEMIDSSVVSSVWRGIGEATHAVFDLTRSNPNVAFELGIADTLGRARHLVCEGVPEENLFANITKRRIAPYSDPTVLARSVAAFLASRLDHPLA